MSDTSTAQRNWLGLSNPLSTNAVSPKEFVELPLLSNYNNAFLETITEEGSEFEPSEDGSASFEQSDYLPFDGSRANQGKSSLVRNDANIMIGELDSPDYEEVFPMSIQPFSALRKEIFDYSNFLIPYAKSVKESSTSNEPAEHNIPTDSKDTRPSSVTVKVDQEILSRVTEEVKDLNFSHDINNTSHCQSCNEGDLPIEKVEDKWDVMVLDHTPGKSQTIKQRGLGVNATLDSNESKSVFENVSVMKVTNSNEPWSDDERNEDMLVLSTEEDRKKFVWKLETGEHSTIVNEYVNQSVNSQIHESSEQQQRIAESCVTTNRASHSVKADPWQSLYVSNSGCFHNSAGLHTTAVKNGLDESNHSAEHSKTPTISSDPKMLVVPAVSRPNLPQFRKSNSGNIEPNSEPPPKPIFPLNGMPDTMLAHVRQQHGSAILPSRPPVPLHSCAKPTVSNNNITFPPTISYRELLSTFTGQNSAKVKNGQSFHSTLDSQQFQPAYCLTEKAVTDSVAIPKSNTCEFSNHNQECTLNPMTSSFPGCFMQSRLNYMRSSQAYTNWPIDPPGRSKTSRLQSASENLLESGSLNNRVSSTVTEILHDTERLAVSRVPNSFSDPHIVGLRPGIDTSWLNTNSSRFQFPVSGKARTIPNTGGTGRNILSPENYACETQYTNGTLKNGCEASSDEKPDGSKIGHLPPSSSTNPQSSSTRAICKTTSPVWIANSTPLAHYYASHSAMVSETCPDIPSNIGRNYPSGSIVSCETRASQHGGPGDNRHTSDHKNIQKSGNVFSKNSQNPRPIQRSFAVVGVSELLAKTDEELSSFMQSTVNKTGSQTDKPRSCAQPDPLDEMSNESSGNQPSSQSGLMDHSPVRRRFQSHRVQPALNLPLRDPLDAESDSEYLERRSFYDYGCDDDDEEEEEEIVNDMDSEDMRARRVKRLYGQLIPDRSNAMNVTYACTEDALLHKLDWLNQETQIIWSDNCRAEYKSARLDEDLSKWDVPFIDSDSLSNEPWNIADAWRTSYSRKAVRANLDEITLSSDRDSLKTSWGSVSALNYLPLDQQPFGSVACSRVVAENDYDEVSPGERKRIRMRSRRESHSCDSSTTPRTKQGSRLQKFTEPWLQRLCGCVRSSRFRRKESI